MVITTWRPLPLTMAFAGVVAAASTATAEVAEVCVECAGPSATYRCVVPDAKKLADYRGGDRVLGYICVSEIARTSGHEKCRVRRGGASQVCIGVERTVSLTAPLLATTPTAPEVAAAAGAAGEGGQAAAEAANGQAAPPKTVAELISRSAGASEDQFKKAGDAVKGTAKSAGDQIKDAGSAVGGAVKKSWQCLTSIFKEC